MCKKNLILESATPVILPLYPGECNLPKETYDKDAEDRILTNVSSDKRSQFIPTPVVRIGLEDFENKKKNSASIDLLNVPWKTGGGNEDDENDENEMSDSDEAESSRAFNTRLVTANVVDEDQIREIVEPILRPHPTKNGRSHDPDKKAKGEITEPILGATTSRNFGAFTVSSPVKNNFIASVKKNSKEISYNFYDVDKTDGNSDWIPSANPQPINDAKWKREDDSKTITSFGYQQRENPLRTIATTVQFLPQRLARMFEQAEKYARETILPLVSTYTPKFISDIILPREEPKYVPFIYDDPTTTAVSDISSQNQTSNNVTVNNNGDIITDNNNKTKDVAKSRSFDPPPTIKSFDEVNATPYTHIQKIQKKGATIETTTTPAEIIPTTTVKEVSGVSRKVRDNNIHSRKNILGMKLKTITEIPVISSGTTRKQSTGIYVDLPVFDNNVEKIKYIPLLHSESSKSVN